MDQEIKERWVAALRSGSYAQARSKLNDGTGFCCLGVLCEIAEQDQVVIKRSYEDRHAEYISKVNPQDYEVAILPGAVSTWSGLDRNPVVKIPEHFFSDEEYEKLAEDGRVDEGRARATLAELNDHFRWDFNKIADVIEASI